MLAIIVLSVATCAVIAGLVLKYFTDRSSSPWEITWKEFALGTLLITLVVAPLTGWGSYKVALNSRATFSQYINGQEIAADVTQITCSRDGPCRWEYDCDPYIVMVPYEVCTTVPGPNGTSSQSCTTHYRPETRYHSCPYVTAEYDYTVRTSVGNFSFADNRFPPNPDSHRWRASEYVPASVIQAAGIGPTPDWSAVRARIDSGRPGPATAVQSYDNYVLASERTVSNSGPGKHRSSIH
jgi:hypothetical protein